MPRIKAERCASNHNTRRDGTWCPGCGLHHAATGEHRADCLTRPPPCPHCLYYPAVNGGQHRPDCTAATR